MKRLITHLILSLAFVASAKTYDPLPAEYDGSMSPYDFAKADTAFVIPDSLEVARIVYVARHGARFLSSQSKISGMEKKLADGSLSADGHAFVALMHQIDSITDGRWGRLSPLGISEEQRLGKEMARMAPDLLAQGRAKSLTTFVPRVIMSAYEFNHALESEHQRLDLLVRSGHQNDSILYFFDYFSAYKEYRESGTWQDVYDEFVAEHVSPEPARRLFVPGHKASDAHLRSLTMDMYAILQGCRAAGFAPPTTQWMTAAEYRGCWLASNLKHYLRNTPNPLNPACLPAVKPLVHSIIQGIDTEEMLDEPDDIVFRGYFGHAETLMPLFAALHLPGCWSENYEDLASHWRVQDVTPLAANMAIIIVRPKGHPKGARYAIVRLNGRPIEPIPGQGPVVPWPLLKAHWLSLM